jgi:hypothetical protein
LPRNNPIATANGSALAGFDYTASSLAGESFAPGVTSKTFAVNTHADGTPEQYLEVFFVNVTGVVGASVLDGQGAGTILDDD